MDLELNVCVFILFRTETDESTVDPETEGIDATDRFF
jgi:hypothetical protein